MAHINTIEIDSDKEEIKVVTNNSSSSGISTASVSPAESEIRERKKKTQSLDSIESDPPKDTPEEDEAEYPEPNLELNNTRSIIPMSLTPNSKRKSRTVPENEGPEIEMRSRFNNNQAPPFDPLADAPVPESSASSNASSSSRRVKSGFQFDPNSYIYYANACCELLHYRVAVVVVGVFELLMIVGWGVFDYYMYEKIGLGTMSFVAIGVQSAIALVFVVSILLLFVGIAKEIPLLLWPHMIFQVIGIAAGIILTIIAVVSMAAGTNIAEIVFGGIFGPNNLPLVQDALGPIWPFCLAVIFDFGAAVGIWFYILARGAYDYLLDKKFFERYAATKALDTNKVVEERLAKGLPETAT